MYNASVGPLKYQIALYSYLPFAEANKYKHCADYKHHSNDNYSSQKSVV